VSNNNESLRKEDRLFNEMQRQQLAEAGFKFGLGAIVAEGLKNPKVVEAAKNVTEQLSKNDEFVKLGAGAVAASAAGAASAPVIVPAAIVIGTSALAVYGLAKLVEHVADND
jgi:hypothetical protein